MQVIYSSLKQVDRNFRFAIAVTYSNQLIDISRRLQRDGEVYALDLIPVFGTRHSPS
jgi:hypothetical protein